MSTRIRRYQRLYLIKIKLQNAFSIGFLYWLLLYQRSCSMCTMHVGSANFVASTASWLPVEHHGGHFYKHSPAEAEKKLSLVEILASLKLPINQRLAVEKFKFEKRHKLTICFT